MRLVARENSDAIARLDDVTQSWADDADEEFGTSAYPEPTSWTVPRTWARQAWPFELGRFWEDVRTPNDAKQAATLIRRFFPRDRTRLQLADWLQTWADRGWQFALDE